jgi:hypothetical protein
VLLAAFAAAAAPAGAQGTPGWVRFLAGGAASILAHEAGHLVAAATLGGTPSIGFDQGRPVVYSGIRAGAHPDRQFAFSASGMTVQLAVNELILLWPHAQGEPAGAFERGVLAGGIGTVLFYFTLGRNASVSDVDQMARYSGVSKWALTAIFGGVAASEMVRIGLNDRYGPHFFVLPGADRTVRAGAALAF